MEQHQMSPQRNRQKKGHGAITFALLTTMLIFPFRVLLGIFWRRWYRQRLRRLAISGCHTSRTIAFFHPFTLDGGGGERVLWCAIRALQKHQHQNRRNSDNIVVYSGDDMTAEELCRRAQTTFGVHVDPSNLDVVPLTLRSIVLPQSYPVATLILQSLASMLLGMEALCNHVPDMFIDTSGYAFIYPLAQLCGSYVAAYVHYPTISTDMLGHVSARKPRFNNRGSIAKSALGTWVKLGYYRIFAVLYGTVGRCANVVIANSTWTRRHIDAIWDIKTRATVVYPPCDTESLRKLPYPDTTSDGIIFMSLAQFRPEKNQSIQIESFKLALDRAKRGAYGPIAQNRANGAQLWLVGSSRNPADLQRATSLAEKASSLGLEKNVTLHLNVTYAELRDLLSAAHAGLHSMEDEHFGIVIVEYMAAGCIPIAHNSGGPRDDIIDVNECGYLASTVEEYSNCIGAVLGMNSETMNDQFAAARQRAGQFSESVFDRGFIRAMDAFV